MRCNFQNIIETHKIYSNKWIVILGNTAVLITSVIPNFSKNFNTIFKTIKTRNFMKNA